MFDRRLFLAWLLVMLLELPVSAAWRVGVARAVITPSQFTWLSGYASRNRPADGKIHDLHAKALAFEDSRKTRLVLVCCDLGSVSAAIYHRVSQAAQKQFQLHPFSLIINVSHTHCAPEVAIERQIFHGLSPSEDEKLNRYVHQELEPKLIALIGDALADLQPTRLSFGQSAVGFAKNRRFPTPKGFVNQQYDAGVVDHDVPVLQVQHPDGKLRAVLFGYACHNTTLNFYKYCGDYAGFAQANVEAAHPGVTALFMLGCAGDQNPYPRFGLELSQQHGKALSDAVERALVGPARDIHEPLQVAAVDATLELEPLPPVAQLKGTAAGAPSLAQRKAKYLLDILEKKGQVELTQTCPVRAVRWGKDLLLIAISGETVVDYSRFCKQEFRDSAVWVAGYCNDVYAYLPSQRVLREGGYEGRDGVMHQLMATPFAPTVEERVMNAIRTAASFGQKQ